MKEVKLAIIGLGQMGTKYVKMLLRNNLGFHITAMDKPLGVKLSDALELLEYNTKLTAFIFQQREYPSHLKIKEILDSKIYGLPKRFCYIVTDWFRPNSYYKSSSWRASYKTDGGGVIINQCPHNLDFIYDLFGMPNQLISFNHNGRYHDIEYKDVHY